MNRLWPILFSFTYFCACINKPEVEVLNANQLQISQDAFKVVYQKSDGGYLGLALFSDKHAFTSLKDSFPNSEKNFRLSPSSDIHDTESIISRTFHSDPKLSVSRSFLLKENTLELNWHFKNTSQQTINGQFRISLQLPVKAKIIKKTVSTQVDLANGVRFQFEHSSRLGFKLNKQELIIFDKAHRAIQASHRDSEKIRIHFALAK
ncbi:hypothetical protein PQO03_21470 [Lentisphaera profundi]|uniref:Lipid/polyisoprenoid-binding YceI-like domain-containing protein n=1 Tax=Lentisphaera profundi TaxID=1658616 RepID=A0ABY7VWU9_9BACT|nr:hypothetical protein [Lentisphaera profundi]WDE98386.1 hypothetical protein PQO03_21470 [Lentisphaera profundi]